ncbi:MAG: decarboxylating NADP(+)-dependent phosphogluconate dehydrogenase [Cocleimonas sp.]|nr:decarboxylating NADP(+)-dependent phosphogluconate dehydrogenase [Cocleimonas sp.]
MATADIGLIGLGVMGQNLALNIHDHGYGVVVYNRTPTKIEEFLSGSAKDTSITAAHTLEALVDGLASPRRIILMIQAGDPVDTTIAALLPLLDQGDIIIDGGNSHFPDTIRRTKALAADGFGFIGAGISGGEEGARHGPSIMPGGNPDSWPAVQPILQSISAHVDGEPCCQWIGEGGAGHYVKMVHNGIEYGDMQLIAEAYQLMHLGLGMTHQEMQATFQQWNKGKLSSYLIEITADIMGVNDTDGEPLLEKIRDTAGQKGTGLWTAMSALEHGMPVTLISEAVFARCLSALKTSRIETSKHYPHQIPEFTGDREVFLNQLCDALYASKIISYAQGFMLMQSASHAYQWHLDYGNIALTWRGGCIIRSQFLNDIKRAYDKKPQLDNLLWDDFFVDAVTQSLSGWRTTIQSAVAMGLPIPAFSSALSFFDSYRSAKTSANLLQAQRDYFGAHTYERIDQPRGEFFHSQWSQDT